MLRRATHLHTSNHLHILGRKTILFGKNLFGLLLQGNTLHQINRYQNLLDQNLVLFLIVRIDFLKSSRYGGRLGRWRVTLLLLGRTGTSSPGVFISLFCFFAFSQANRDCCDLFNYVKLDQISFRILKLLISYFHWPLIFEPLFTHHFSRPWIFELLKEFALF